jgi:prepilin-type processing-associated H-X9-DG protein
MTSAAVTPPPFPSGAPVQPKMSGLAVASLICGIAGFCTAGLAGLVGLILGIIGISKVSKSGGAMRGMGLAIAGVVVSAISLLITPVVVAILVPAFSAAQSGARVMVSMNNMKQLGIAVQMYAIDNGGRFPPADQWPDLLQKGSFVTPQVWADPDQDSTGRGYSMNSSLSDKPLSFVKDPARTVIFFECKPGSPPGGGPELLPEQPPHGGVYVIGFVDGHAEVVPPDRVRSLIWQPQGN